MSLMTRVQRDLSALDAARAAKRDERERQYLDHERAPYECDPNGPADAILDATTITDVVRDSE